MARVHEFTGQPTPGLYTSLNAFDVSPSNPAAMTLMSLVLTKKTTDERGHFGDFGSESMLPSFTHSAAGISGARQQRRAAVASVASLELLL